MPHFDALKVYSFGKHLEERKNCLLQAISPFLTMFSTLYGTLRCCLSWLPAHVLWVALLIFKNFFEFKGNFFYNNIDITNDSICDNIYKTSHPLLEKCEFIIMMCTRLRPYKLMYIILTVSHTTNFRLFQTKRVCR